MLHALCSDWEGGPSRTDEGDDRILVRRPADDQAIYSHMLFSYAAEDTVEAKIVNRAKDNHSSLYAKVQDDRGSRRIIQAASVARKGGDDLSGK